MDLLEKPAIAINDKNVITLSTIGSSDCYHLQLYYLPLPLPLPMSSPSSLDVGYWGLRDLPQIVVRITLQDK